MRKTKILFLVFLTVGILFFAVAASIGIAGALGLFSNPRRLPSPKSPPPPGFSVEADGAADVIYDTESFKIHILLPEETTEFDVSAMRFPERYTLFGVYGIGTPGQTIPIVENTGFEIDLKHESEDGLSSVIYRFEVLVFALPTQETIENGHIETASRITDFRCGGNAFYLFPNPKEEGAP